MTHMTDNRNPTTTYFFIVLLEFIFSFVSIYLSIQIIAFLHFAWPVMFYLLKNGGYLTAAAASKAVIAAVRGLFCHR